MTSIAHIDIAPAAELKDQILAAGMVDIDMSIVFMLGLFLVFAVLMHYLVLKPLIASQEARYKGMGGAREDASSYELKAAELRLEYERRMTRARQDAVQIRDAIKREAQAAQQDRIVGMQQAVDQQVEGAKGELERFAGVARTEMHSHAEALAIDLSNRMIGGKA